MTYLKYFESKSFIEDYNYNLFKNDSIVLMNKKELITIINIINKLGLLKDYEYIDHINYLNKSKEPFHFEMIRLYGTSNTIRLSDKCVIWKIIDDFFYINIYSDRTHVYKCDQLSGLKDCLFFLKDSL